MSQLEAGLDLLVATPGRLQEHVQVRVPSASRRDRFRAVPCPPLHLLHHHPIALPLPSSQAGNLKFDACKAIVLDEVDVLLGENCLGDEEPVGGDPSCPLSL